MLSGIPLGADWQRRVVKMVLSMARWNPYVSNWPLVLSALRQLWEVGKVSELKSPYYEAVEKPANQ
jgi:hypothetical protein